MEPSADSDEAKLLLLISERLEQTDSNLRRQQVSHLNFGVGRSNLRPTWDANGVVTLRGLAAAFSIKQKCSQDTFESFSPQLCFFLSLLFYSITTIPGGGRREP